jgi:hypothetical protein
MFDDARQRDPLAALPIRRYHKVNRPIWRPEKGRVHEVATLPNEDDAEKFENEVKEIVFDSATAKKVQAVDALAKYRPLFNKLAADVRDKARVGSGTKAYQLANQIDKLLTEKGVPDAKGNVLSMTDFWIHDDPSVKTMKDQLENLRKQVNYGDPFIVAQTYGKGKVVAVLSTAGKEWNDWAGGTIGSIIFPMFIWDLQKYLSSPGAEDNLTVGRTLPELKFDAEQFKLNRLKMVRTFMKTVEGKDKAEAHSEQFGRDDGGYISFFLTNNRVPGVYRSELIDDNAVDKKALAAWEHAFNVDTEREGKLQRVSQNDLRTHLFEAGKGDIKPVDIGTSDDVLVPKLNDLSESPWLFLLLLLVLVAEQALAVHLSFHLRSTDQELATAGAKV